jgi:Na+-driven multidrug efflux pump
MIAPIIMPLYGKTFTDYTPLTVLALSTVPTALAQVLEMALYSRERMWTSFSFNMVWAIATLWLSYIFLEHNQGATGIAWAILLAYVIKMLCMGGFLIFVEKGGKV